MAGRPAWKAFRELTVPKWSEAFVATILKETNSTEFTYVTAVSKVRGDKGVWESYHPFRKALGGNPIQILTFEEMVLTIQKKLTKTLAPTEVGRILQMFQVSGFKMGEK